MGDKVKETHKYSRTFHFVKLTSAFFLGFFIFLGLYIPLEKVVSGISTDILAMILIAGSIIVSWLVHKFMLNKVYDTLSTMAYMKNDLETIVSYADATYLKRMFEPAYVKSENWFAMQNLKALPPEHRRKAAMDAAKKILDPHTVAAKHVASPQNTQSASQPKPTTRK
jgi:hypothetical protein